MKRRVLIMSLLSVFVVEVVFLLIFSAGDTDNLQETVVVNEAVQSVQKDWGAMENHKNPTDLDYVVIDGEKRVLFKTKEGLSESLNEAVIHRDTILDIEADGENVGKIIIYNDSMKILRQQKERVMTVLAALLFLQCVICIGYILYLNRTIITPFGKLKGFAERIAGGNFDIPLEMDRQNLFGAFTESFDIMRTELKRARIAEAEANASKKELVAKLSHDIKTPIASIKAASEVGVALAADEKAKDNYTQIIHKADQINTLLTNLFTATLEELKQLSVTPADMESGEIGILLENADYLHRGVVPAIPGCILYADRLRLQQVFDNIFANSYKYADTEIEITVCKSGPFLAVEIEDDGGGVNEEELPLLKEKFKRGKNTKDVEGAGLGLFISDYFMKEMKGELVVENGKGGLKVMVKIPFSGRI